MNIARIWILAGIIAAGILSTVTEATIFIKAHNKSFPPDSIFNDDVYVGINNIKFESTVKGDLVGASQEMAYSGYTDGNLLWGCRAISVNGPVGGTFITFAQDVEINAPVGRNMVAFASKVTTGPKSDIARDLTVFCGELSFEGKCGGNLRAYCETANVSGAIKGDLRIKAKELSFGPNAVVEGEVYYEGPALAKIPEGAQIGEIHWKQPPPKESKPSYKAFLPAVVSIAVFIVFNWIFTLFTFLLAILLGNAAIIPLLLGSMIVSGIIIIAISKKSALKVVTVLENQWLTALGLGFVMVLLFPFVAALAIFTIIGLPFGLLMVFGYGIALFAGSAYVCLYVGKLVCKLLKLELKEPGYLCYTIGVIIIGALALMPFVRWIVVLATLMIGLGSIAIASGKIGKKSLAGIEKSNN